MVKSCPIYEGLGITVILLSSRMTGGSAYDMGASRSLSSSACGASMLEQQMIEPILYCAKEKGFRTPRRTALRCQKNEKMSISGYHPPYEKPHKLEPKKGTETRVER
jgi:hypothetical protein